jgi:hypothetical protein
MTMVVAAADPEVAAATLTVHLDALWASGRPGANGWKRFPLDPLRWMVVMPAQTLAGERTHFFVRLDGRAYDRLPVDVAFVDPSDWEPATGGRWWPLVDPAVPAPRQSWFGLHPAYNFAGTGPRQLICFSFTLGYYESNHTPAEAERWRHGHHTVAATLNRLAEILSPAHFRGVAS